MACLLAPLLPKITTTASTTHEMIDTHPVVGLLLSWSSNPPIPTPVLELEFLGSLHNQHLEGSGLGDSLGRRYAYAACLTSGLLIGMSSEQLIGDRDRNRELGYIRSRMLV